MGISVGGRKMVPRSFNMKAIRHSNYSLDESSRRTIVSKNPSILIENSGGQDYHLGGNLQKTKVVKKKKLQLLNKSSGSIYNESIHN